MASVVLLQMYGQTSQCKYLANVEVRVGKPADGIMKVKSSEAFWFLLALHLTSVEAKLVR